MFFSDLGSNTDKYPTKIERAYMDGSRRFVLVKEKIEAPVGMWIKNVVMHSL